MNLSFENVVTDYYDLVIGSNNKKINKSDFYGSRISILRNENDLIEISNSAFRYVKIQKSYIDNDQVLNTAIVAESMSGGVTSSWGSLFTWSMFDPSILVDESYAPPTQSTISEYWVSGLGVFSTIKALGEKKSAKNIRFDYSIDSLLLNDGRRIELKQKNKTVIQ